MLWRAGLIHLNGETLRPPAHTRVPLRRLADQRFLRAGELPVLSGDDALWPILHEWAVAGWLQTGVPERELPASNSSATGKSFHEDTT